MSYQAVEYKKFRSQRPFGVELEVGNEADYQDILKVIERKSKHGAVYTEWQQTNRNSWWNVKTDSTCGAIGRGMDFGWEVVSYKAAGFRDMLDIADVAESLRLAGICVNDNCGLHVHVEVKDFTPEQVGTLVACWLKVEPFMLQAVPRRRLQNDFCMPQRGMRRLDFSKPFTAAELWEAYRPRSLDIWDNPDRRVTLNLVNYATGLKRKSWSRRTVEFRLPEGSLMRTHVKNWIRLFVNFVECCKYRTMPPSLLAEDTQGALRYLGLGHEPQAFSILSEGLRETKTWLLGRVLSFGHEPWWSEARRTLNVMWEPVKSY